MNVLCQALCMLGNSLRWTIPREEPPAYISECLNWILHLLPSRTQTDQQRPFAERREILAIELTHSSSFCGQDAGLYFKRSDKSQVPNIPKSEKWLGETLSKKAHSPLEMALGVRWRSNLTLSYTVFAPEVAACARGYHSLPLTF
ncbi:unnamed protein product [Rangifer tarandus platyrhynchus]|uniref:Uncharacterized protein n=1 Tax=Rangifer tarandus platyrhynchus TaxID=3082113 RepID=A0ABN8YNC0_RANTA|nr:unnamed protein product [Rangifer tarandus platyrhynchus]